ncbi:MAG: hypothetical protein H0U74_04615 [Bradymonadaceae bacterium]|nr:hypothetical protein [Lujinxingiaceae bacterium]
MFFSIIALVTGAILAGKFYANNKTNEAMGLVANTLGLHFIAAGWLTRASMSGKHLGIEVSVFEDVRGSGKSKTRWAVYRATIPKQRVPVGLVLYREGFGSKIGKLFGGQDIQVGDAEIDQALIVRGAQVAEIREFFARPGVKQTLLELNTMCPNFRFEDGSIKLEYMAALRETVVIRNNIETLVRATLQIAGIERDALKATAPPRALAAGVPAQDPWAPPQAPTNDENSSGHW